jgi:hypothetical protein
MALLETWCPPSREHWEFLVFLWQFFPIVRLHPQKLTNHSLNFGITVHTLPMAILLVSYGQDLHRVSLQRPWENWMGYNGGTWVHHAIIFDVLLAEAGRD